MIERWERLMSSEGRPVLWTACYFAAAMVLGVFVSLEIYSPAILTGAVSVAVGFAGLAIVGLGIALQIDWMGSGPSIEWKSPQNRSTYSQVVALTGLAVVALSFVASVAPEILPARRGLGIIQIVILANGLLVAAIAVSIAYYFRSVAPVLLPIVSGTSRAITGLDFASEEAVSSGGLLTAGSSSNPDVWVTESPVTAVSLGSVALLVNPPDANPVMVHLSRSCRQGCASSATIAPELEFALIDLNGQPDRPMALVSGSMNQQDVGADHDLHELSRAVERNLSPGGVVEISPGTKRTKLHVGRVLG